MRCARCLRYLSKPAATVTTGEGTATYGPTCAVKLGLLAATVKKARKVARRARRNDGQMDLLGAMA